MFGTRVPLIRIFGIQFWTDASWVFVAVFMTWSLAVGWFPASYPHLSSSVYLSMGAICTLGFFLSLFIHELTHGLFARVLGIKTSGITLYFFGRMDDVEDEPPSATVEICTAFVGPLISVALGFVFLAITAYGDRTWGDPVLAVVSCLGVLNFLIAAFNLVPGYPLDGGRLLRAILWKRSGNFFEATRIASIVGSVIALVLVCAGIFTFSRGSFVGGMWWVLLGIFLRSAAHEGCRRAEAREILRHDPVRNYMSDNPIEVSPDLTLRSFVDDYLSHYSHRVFPVTKNHQLIGYVKLENLKSIPRADWDRHRVRDVAENCPRTHMISPETEADKALARMRQSGDTKLFIVDKGTLLGIVSLKDMLRRLSIQMEILDREKEAA